MRCSSFFTSICLLFFAILFSLGARCWRFLLFFALVHHWMFSTKKFASFYTLAEVSKCICRLTTWIFFLLCFMDISLQIYLSWSSATALDFIVSNFIIYHTKHERIKCSLNFWFTPQTVWSKNEVIAEPNRKLQFYNVTLTVEILVVYLFLLILDAVAKFTLKCWLKTACQYFKWLYELQKIEWRNCTNRTFNGVSS